MPQIDKVYEDDDAAPTQVHGALVGPYRLGSPIGSGGMANVYEAVNVMTGQRVALKVLQSRCSGVSEVVARFAREGRALQKMTHPNIVRVLDHGVSSEGDAWIAMERLSGAPLDQLIKRGRLSEGRALRLMTDVAKALATVHARGMVHRDLKPENVFVVDAGAPHEHAKLIDFGVAHVAADDLGDHSIQYTNVGSILGSTSFMAPEQIDGRGRAPTSASDIFSFGVTLYEALTGRLPFEGTTAVELLRARKRGAIVPVRKRIGACSRALEDFITRALSYDAALRPQNGLELIQELNVLQGLPAVSGIMPVNGAMRLGPADGGQNLRAGNAPPPARESASHFDIGVGGMTAPPVRGRRAGIVAALIGIGAALSTIYVLHALHLF